MGPSKYSYHLEIKEDRDDGRLHDDSKISTDISEPDLIPITEITKLLYTNSAAILNIKDDSEAYSTPILLLKRESDATDPSNVPDLETSDDETQYRIDCQILNECNGARSRSQAGDPTTLPSYESRISSYLDPEWIALEMYTADASDESQCDEGDAESTPECSDESEQELNCDAASDGVANQLSSLSLEQNSSQQSDDPSFLQKTPTSISQGLPNNLFNMVTTSLSLLELVIRLASLQETQQKSHLSIPDHVLTSFLNGTVQADDTGKINSARVGVEV